MKIKRLAVFCGASKGADSQFVAMVRQLGLTLAAANIALVFGGGKVGLMGEIAKAMLDVGAEVIGVMPQFLVDKEIAFTAITKLHVVQSMSERKALITELADGFIMLPGGAGTLEEFFEVYTLAQLGLHQKPLGILNIENYFEHFFKFIDHAVTMNFMASAYRDMLLVAEDPKILLEKLMSYQASTQTRWVEESIKSN